jgi:hypothetical protein
MPNDANKQRDLVARAPTSLAAAVEDFGLLMDPVKFEQLWRVAKIFAASDFVPEQYRGKEANCFVAAQAAMRLQVDPFMFMQHCPVIHGRPGLDGQMAIALINSRGPFDGPIQWRFSGAGDSRECTAYAKMRKSGDLCELTITWATVKGEGWTGNKKWETMTQQMFRYRTASWLGRAYCPEVLMGLPTSDEIEDLAFSGAIDVRAERVAEAPIELPRAKAETRAPANAAPAQATTVAGTVDKATGEVVDATKAAEVGTVQNTAGQPQGADASQGEPNSDPGKAAIDAAIRADPMNLKRLASKPQREMIIAIATKHKGLSEQKLNELLADKFAFTLQTLPVSLVNEVLQFVNGL